MTNDANVELGSPDRFGHSWNIFSEILPVHEEQFLRWTAGMEKADWAGKRFIDVGCSDFVRRQADLLQELEPAR